MPSSEPPGEVPGVKIGDSHGIQVGSGNTMYNLAPKPPLDPPAAMRDLNPHIAVARLRQLSHDELVSFFVRAQPGDVSEILEVFVGTDLLKVVAALGDLNRRKATELISAFDMGHVAAVLGDLPEAAEAIARKAGIVGWADAAPLEAFTEGYARRYDNGSVCWSPGSGVTRTTGAIDDYYWAEGSPDWGFPVKDHEPAVTSPYGTTGVRQRFQPSTVYSSKHGVFLVTDAMCYENEGGSGGWLGFPRSGRERNGQFGDRQIFEGGAIYSCVVQGPEELKSFAVRREISIAFYTDGTWFPVAKETPAVSSSGRRGTTQRFEIRNETGTYGTAIYWDEVADPVMVAPIIWDYYKNLGAEKSRLGLPMRKKENLPRSGSICQEFEGGKVYRVAGEETVAVSAEVEALIQRSRMLGFPVSEEHSVGEDGSGRIQYFEKGVVTLRDGKHEIWLRPDSNPNPGSDPEPPVGKADETEEAAREAQRQAAKSEILRWSTAATRPKWRPDTPDSQA